MNTKVASKAAVKTNSKTNTMKPGVDAEKAINQLRQEIKNLNKVVKDMQQKQDSQAIILMIPQKLLVKVNAYLSKVSPIMGRPVTLSELTYDALDVYICADEENIRVEKNQGDVDLEKNKKKSLIEEYSERV
jgi:hypothetical protein